jgi:hypothetical protein
MTEPDNTPDPAWKDQLWSDLAAMGTQDQFVAAGEWIAWVTKVLLPQLGTHRRDMIMKLIDDEDWDTARVAEEFGMRRSTVIRLLDEGRHVRRKERLAAAAKQDSGDESLDSAPPLPVT